jgi:hypothetical protein
LPVFAVGHFREAGRKSRSPRRSIGQMPANRPKKCFD